MAKELNTIDKWNDETVIQIFGMYLEGMSAIKQGACNLKYITVKDKRDYLIAEQKKFEKNVK